MYKDFIERKSIMISFDSTAAVAVDGWNSNIFLNFQPDEVIVKNISMYSYAAVSNETTFIRSSLVDNNILCGFNHQNATFYLNNRFPINQPINGTYHFSVLAADLTDSGTFAFQVGIMLEFIKYNK